LNPVERQTRVLFAVVAVRSLQVGQEWHPETPQRLRDAGQRVMLREGQSLGLDMKLAAGI
jgi:hypothetical protein